jgi:hypothetical protein
LDWGRGEVVGQREGDGLKRRAMMIAKQGTVVSDGRVL